MHKRITAIVVGLAVAWSPCAAAEMDRFADVQPAGIGASVSAYLRIPFSGSSRDRSRPHLGLRMSVLRGRWDTRAGIGQVDRADVLDLRLTGLASPTLFVAGRQATGPDRRLNALGTAGTIGLVAGGAAVLLLVAVAAGGAGFGDTCPTVGGRRDHCINP